MTKEKRIHIFTRLLLGAQSLGCMCSVLWIIVCLTTFFFSPLCWLSFNLRPLITPLISSNFSYHCFNLALNVECDWKVQYYNNWIHVYEWKVINLRKSASRMLTTWYLSHMKAIIDYYIETTIRRKCLNLVNTSEFHILMPPLPKRFYSRILSFSLANLATSFWSPQIQYLVRQTNKNEENPNINR